MTRLASRRSLSVRSHLWACAAAGISIAPAESTAASSAAAGSRSAVFPKTTTRRGILRMLIGPPPTASRNSSLPASPAPDVIEDVAPRPVDIEAGKAVERPGVLREVDRGVEGAADIAPVGVAGGGADAPAGEIQDVLQRARRIEVDVEGAVVEQVGDAGEVEDRVRVADALLLMADDGEVGLDAGLRARRPAPRPPAGRTLPPSSRPRTAPAPAGVSAAAGAAHTRERQHRRERPGASAAASPPPSTVAVLRRLS